ncbi:beta-ribofuranosylaminobenzene 5'-phosphate synthase [Methanobrevibacter millerae]|uniref:Beta-ribofuranosylaminobenzene 5'-phosphate synthase n=1 Tax=Methanobrevibacter millerae TaxID=230361 RepID=A0A1G5UWK0_9EURY|nr:beta-ribofuranosylaminobenzene 5'-phosphate synthase [Methanobrevibacter millerae]SDA37407.1 beta-ribofuranosylaminobenzene 5'-phosphate synthase [Methanobrevibacter millerae]
MYIKSPSRLHLGLIDMNGSYGRLDGGIGLAIQDPNFCLYGESAENGITIDFNENYDFSDEIRNECVKKINDAAQKVIDYYDVDEGFYFRVDKAFPPHSGLGSGTQIALSTGKLITEHIGEESNGVSLGKITGRGGTSGIGVFAFDHGGFIVDGGHSKKEKDSFLPSSASKASPPQLFGRYEFPEEWGVLLVILKSDVSVNGQKEVNIFQEYCPIDTQEVELYSHLVFMNMIPFLIEKDLPCFGNIINKIQTIGFKNIEVSLQTDNIKNLMKKLREIGAYAVGMSSFGPTVYSFYDETNKHIVDEIKDYVGDDGIVITTKAQNHGHILTK